MAQKTVCDVCFQDITKEDTAPFEFRGRTIRTGCQLKTGNPNDTTFAPMDICRHCRADAAKVMDDRPPVTTEEQMRTEIAELKKEINRLEQDGAQTTFALSQAQTELARVFETCSVTSGNMDKVIDELTTELADPCVIPEGASLNDIYAPATQITTQETADWYWEGIITYHMAECVKKGIPRTREEAEERERVNLSYFVMHYDKLTRCRVERLFKVRHPIFGAVADRGRPTVEEAYLIGWQHAQWMRMRGLGIGYKPK